MDAIKNIVKQWFPHEHWISLSWWRMHYGAWAALRTHARLMYAADKLLRVPVTVAGTRHHVYLRPGTTDLDVYDEVFVEKEYHIDFAKPGRIIDAGAHIGLSAVVLGLRYPQATLIALEPEPGNYRMLERNVAGLANVKTVNAGVWSRAAGLRVVDADHTTWGFQVIESDAADAIPALGMVDIVARLGSDGPLLVKMDIEGSEVEALSGDPGWMRGLETLVIELHDRFRPGCRKALDDALSSCRYETSVSGENLVISKVQFA